MKKVGRHITVDYDVDMWLRTTEYNVSELCNSVLRSMMEVNNRAPLDEKELSSEISYLEEKMQTHRESLLAKRAELARLQHERDKEREESRRQKIAMVDAIRASGMNR